MSWRTAGRRSACPWPRRDCRSARRRPGSPDPARARAQARRAAARRRRAASDSDAGDRRARPIASSCAARAAASGLPASSSGTATFSSAVMVGIRWNDWKTMPTWRPRKRASSSSLEGIEGGAVHHHLSAVGAFQSRHDHQERGLARAGRTDQADRFPRSDAQADILQDMHARGARAEREVDVGDGDRCPAQCRRDARFDEAVHGSVIWHFGRRGRGGFVKFAHIIVLILAS